MASKASPVLRQALRSYSTTAKNVNATQDRIGSAMAVAYWCAVVSAPLAGAFVISQAARKDKRFSNMRPLSFRDCLPSSSLDDYAGAFMHLRK